MGKTERIRILVTRPMTDEQIALAHSLGLHPAVVPALAIDIPDRSRKITTTLESAPGTAWVFTSANAVEALRRFSEEEPIPVPVPKIYAVGEKTAERLAELNLASSSPQRQDAVGLAALIAQDFGVRPRRAENSPVAGKKKQVVHWCGNRSRKELGEELNAAGIDLIRLEVYRSELNPVRLPEDPGEGILFFSPSGVQAFGRNGDLNRELPELFAVGNTTAEALGLESGSVVHIPSVPSIEAMLELAAAILAGKKRETNKHETDQT